MKDLIEILKFLLGFASWIVFLFLSGSTFTSLERALVISFIISLIFGYRQLRGGFILQWGSVIFFAWCIIMVNCLKNVTVAKSMGVIANGFLASIIWLTILVENHLPYSMHGRIFRKNDGMTRDLCKAAGLWR
jgi:hypothetical protein